MTTICINCKNVTKFNTKKSNNLIQTDSPYESDLKSIINRLDVMQEMITKIVKYIPAIANEEALMLNEKTLISKQEMSVPFSPFNVQNQKSSFKMEMATDEENIVVAQSFISENQKTVGRKSSQLPNVILEQPIQNDTIGSWTSSCENSQDSIDNDCDMSLHESFLEATMQHMAGEEELELLENIDNVYQLENLHTTFPILQQEELDNMESLVVQNDSYKEQLLRDMKVVRISMGVNCEFADILEKLLDRELLHYYNWYGNQGKKNLQQYKIFSQLLKEITVPPTGKSFDDLMHRAITVSHRRKNNQVYRRKRRADAFFGKLS